MPEEKRRSPPLFPADGLWLVLTVAITLLPHLGALPLWLGGGVILLLGARLLTDLRAAPPPGKVVLGLLALALTVLIGMHYQQIFGRAPGLALLSAFLCLKLLEARTRRDALAVVLLSFFMQLGQFLQSQSMGTAAFTVLGVLVATASLLRLQGMTDIRAVARLASLLALQGLPLMLLLFVLFPRVQGPLWGLPGDAFSGTTGLSESMEPGSISNLVRSGEIVFRADFSGEPPPPRLRYWRGPVLSTFDGRSWTQARRSEAGTPFYRTEGKAYAYTMTLEPNRQRWLLALEVPLGGPDNTRYSSDFQLLSKDPVNGRLRYSASAYPETRTGLSASPAALRAQLAVPSAGNPRARALGDELQRTYQNPAARIAALVGRFRENALIYTLNPPLLGANPIDEFLFETRRGFCEHFASAFVFVARAAGVPARIVTGYQGGELNPVDGSLVVRQSDAHAWTEVWLEGRGWTRVDPTAESNPSRVDDGIGTALSGEAGLPFMIRADLDWLHAARYRWEAVNNAWNQWVLGYDPLRQRQLLGLLGMKSVDWRQLTALMFALCGIVMAMLLAWAYARPRDGDALDKSWSKLCAILKRRGVTRSANEGPLDFTRRAASALPEQADRLERIGALYARLRYGPGGDDDDPTGTTLERLIEEIGKRQ